MVFFSSCQHGDGERCFTSAHISGSSVERWADVNQGADSLLSPLHNNVPSHHWLTRGTADRYGANSSMHFVPFSINNFLQTLLPTASPHLFNTLPYTPFNTVQTNKPTSAATHFLCMLTGSHPCFTFPHPGLDHMCTHARTRSPKWASRVAALLRLPESVSSLWACCVRRARCCGLDPTPPQQLKHTRIICADFL